MKKGERGEEKNLKSERTIEMEHRRGRVKGKVELWRQGLMVVEK